MYREGLHEEYSFLIQNYLDMAYHKVCLESYYYVETSILY